MAGACAGDFERSCLMRDVMCCEELEYSFTEEGTEDDMICEDELMPVDVKPDLLPLLIDWLLDPL